MRILTGSVTHTSLFRLLAGGGIFVGFLLMGLLWMLGERRNGAPIATPVAEHGAPPVPLARLPLIFEASAYNRVVLRLYGGRGPDAVATTTTIEDACGVASDAWTESSLTWKTRPALSAVLSQATLRGTAAGWVEWDVTAYVMARRSAGASVVSLVIVMDQPPVPDDSVDTFSSRQAASNPPQLVFSAQP